MSELKAIQGVINGQQFELYFKSEADKVIADYEKEIDELQDKVTNLLLRDRNMALNFNNAVDALVYNKYKRCLAMALLWLERAENSTDLENELVSRRRCSKWMELAEKFKEAK